MSESDLLNQLPARWIKAVDGMSVTAQVWEEAHEYHRQRQRYHQLLQHCSGIVRGLDVIASDPADTSVYVRPGVAVDPQGELIILREPVAFDLGEARGLLYLLLSYGESQLEPDEVDKPAYVFTQFGLEVAWKLPDTPCVELARIRRTSRDAAIRDAINAEYPGPDEIDQRFRCRATGLAPGGNTADAIAVCYAHKSDRAGDGHGAGQLARVLRHTGRQVWVDDGVPLDAGLAGYTLVYLVGEDTFQLDPEQIGALLGYLQQGGQLFIENCGRHSPDDDQLLASSLQTLAESLDTTLEPMANDHPLLSAHHLFSTPPPGYASVNDSQFLVGDGLIYSPADYGCLWRGERQDGPASREVIRCALEWGENLLAYARQRRAALA